MIISSHIVPHCKVTWVVRKGVDMLHHGQMEKNKFRENHLNLTHKIINTKLLAINYRKSVKKHELFLNSMTSV